MSSIDIIEVQNRSDLNKFIKLPLRLYRNEKYYVPHLISERKAFFDRDKNPFFEHARAKYFLAIKKGKAVGRIAGIVNDLHNDFHDEKAGFFGFLDCIDDPDTAGSLLRAAGDYVRGEGMELIRGPMNFSTNDEVGLLIEGFDYLPTFMMPYNPPYYIPLYERLGLKKARDLIAFYLDDSNPISERWLKIVEKMRARSRIKTRTIRMNEFQSELEIIRTIYNSAWSKNWGFVPMTEEEFQHTADDFKKLVDPDLVFIAFVDDEPAGFILGLPDYNPIFKKMNGRLFPTGIFKFLYYTKVNKFMHRLRVLTMGVVHKYQKLGLDAIFFVDIYNAGRRNEYHCAELSWILEDNVMMIKAAENMGARPYKKYRIYEKTL
ncbi:MAG: N-acetyltransferase [Candidatus Zixiibacteriota bacterium]|nr:MAG: N-acetyltransferase [candidate division Zixibacteria bacterium]